MQNPTSNANNDISQRIAHERIYQAHLAFNLAYAATLMLGKIPAGSITTAIGLTSSLCCNRLAKDTNDRLDKLMAELDDA